MTAHRVNMNGNTSDLQMICRPLSARPLLMAISSLLHLMILSPLYHGLCIWENNEF